MIKSIALQNFQSHKNTEIELSSGVNLLVGQSDSGKTAILRALLWVIENRPLGDSFRSSWGGDTCVDVTTTDGLTVSREKGKKNIAVLSRNDGTMSPMEFKAMGSTSPLQIVTALNMGSINIQAQLDPPFLLSESSGEVAQTLNKLVNLDEIDRAISAINSKARKITQDLKYAEETQDDIDKELRNYETLDKCEVDLNILTTLSADVDAAIRDHNRLIDVLEQIDSVKAQQSDNETILQHDKAITQLENRAKQYHICKNDLQTLKDTVSAIKSLKTQIQAFSEIPQAEKLLGKIEGAANYTEKHLSVVKKLQAVVGIIHVTRGHQTETNYEYLTCTKEFKKLMPEICPLCSQQIKS